MYRYGQSNDYRNHYSYRPRNMSISSRNTHRQFYDSRVYNQQMITAAFYPSYLQQPPLTTILDIPEPTSLFDELGYIRHRRTNITPFPPVYVPSNRRTSGNIARFAKANDFRERLLIDIQHNINEIDHELALIDHRPIIPLYIPISFSNFQGRLPPSQHETRVRPIEPRRKHKVIPRIPSKMKKISSHSTPTRRPRHRIISPAFVGQYHYAPEMEENEIRDNDPENTDQNLVAQALSKLNFYKPLTLEEFRREQSAMAENRALIIVPTIAGTDQPKVVVVKKTEETQTIKPVDTHPPSPISMKTSQDFTSMSKLKFRNFEPLIQNSAETSKPMENGVSDATTNPMISRPVKHTPSFTQKSNDVDKPISPSLPKMFKSFSTDDGVNGTATYLLKDVTDESIVPNALRAVHPERRALRTESELKTDDVIEDDHHTNGHPRTPAVQEQDEKRSEPQKTKYVITDVYTSPLSPTTSSN